LQVCSTLATGLTGSGIGATFFHATASLKPMAKKNIYIPDPVYSKMSAEAEKRNITFSHACSLAFSHWLDTIKSVSDSVNKHYGIKEKDPSENR
jgi:hypothetical protein